MPDFLGGMHDIPAETTMLSKSSTLTRFNIRKDLNPVQYPYGFEPHVLPVPRGADRHRHRGFQWEGRENV